MAKLFFLCALLALCACDAYKILVIFPIPAGSHMILGDGVIRHLLNAGHEVTAILPSPGKNTHEKLTQVFAESNKKLFNDKSINIKAVMDKQVDFSDFTFILELMGNLSINTIQDDNVQKFLKDPTQKFDAIVGEWMFAELYSSLPAIYNCPFIWFSTLDPHWLVLRLIDEAPNPAFSTDYLTSYLPPYSLTRRVEQLWNQIKGDWSKQKYTAQEKQVYEETIAPIAVARSGSAPPYEDLLYNASLMLGNSHLSLGSPSKLPQSYKPIGGYHIDTNVKPLPEDLQKIMDNAKHGVIYFSMGSNLKSKDIPQNLKDGFLKVFSGLKQTVLWKFEEILPNLPKNVHILTWAPQTSILAHPNCVLFITHGGLLSTTEAVHFAVPIIGIPVFADQFANVEQAVNKGFARKVELSYTMDKELKTEIDEIIGNPKYIQKVKEWSFIYHHRPVTPGQEMVHWVEHVIKTGGATHLRSPALLLPWYQKIYLDLIVLVIVAVVVITSALKPALGRVKAARKNFKKKKSL